MQNILAYYRACLYRLEMTTYGYTCALRVGNHLSSQHAALVADGAAVVFHDPESGLKGNRSELAKALQVLEAGDTLIVTRLDRLARSSRELLGIIDSIARAGAFFRSLGEAWADTTTDQGRFLLPVLSGLAEFERGRIVARTGAGRARAAARGIQFGRPPRLTADQRSEALRALAAGAATQADLARRFKVSQSTISRLGDTLTPTQQQPKLDADTERAARVFMGRIAKQYPVDRAILFGSRARRTHSATSDADIAVVLKGKRGKRSSAAIDMAGIAFDVMLETGILVEALPLWGGELETPERFSNPALIRAIKREGVAL
jgi:DNA invertase Pin-like site-specific DNA recombinase/predicted nucleotidyltransferase